MRTDNSATLVAVTGTSGFICLHCVLALLQQGFRVRGTLRDMAREASLREILENIPRPADGWKFAPLSSTATRVGPKRSRIAAMSCMSLRHFRATCPSMKTN